MDLISAQLYYTRAQFELLCRVVNVLLLPTLLINGGQEKDLAHPTLKKLSLCPR